MPSALKVQKPKTRRSALTPTTAKHVTHSALGWRLVLWSPVIPLTVAWLAAVTEQHRLHHCEQLADREAALTAADYSRLWFALDRLPDVADDPRAAQKLGYDIDAFVVIHKLPSTSIMRFLHGSPLPRRLVPGTTVVQPHVQSIHPATVIELAVHDPDGQFTEGLTRVDFELFQNETRLRRVQVARAVREAADQFVIVLLDCSTSMNGTPLQTAKEVATDFVQAIAKSNQIQIWRFSDKATALTPWSSEREIQVQAIQNLTARGNTALYAGMQSAILALSQRQGHRSLVILTDGEDSTKTILPASLITLAKQHEVELHLVGLLSGKIDASILRSFAQETDGSFHAAADGAGLKTAFHHIADQLRKPVYRIVILDPVSPETPLILRMDGLSDVTLRF